VATSLADHGYLAPPLCPHMDLADCAPAVGAVPMDLVAVLPGVGCVPWGGAGGRQAVDRVPWGVALGDDHLCRKE